MDQRHEKADAERHQVEDVKKFAAHPDPLYHDRPTGPDQTQAQESLAGRLTRNAIEMAQEPDVCDPERDCRPAAIPHCEEQQRGAIDQGSPDTRKPSGKRGGNGQSRPGSSHGATKLPHRRMTSPSG